MDPAVLTAAALSFDPDLARVAWTEWIALSDDEQQALLDHGDRAGLSLYLWRAAQDLGFAERIRFAGDYRERRRKNEIRLQQRVHETAELCALFDAQGFRFAVLKGFLMAPDFIASAADRSQYDLDFYLGEADARAAFEMLRARGYKPVAEAQDGPSLHLPTLENPAPRTWRGDFYDPEHPVLGIELHTRLWYPEFERIFVSFDPDPLERLIDRNGFPSFRLDDQLAACTLHALRHVFRSSLRLSHLYEIASFLARHERDESFWASWRVWGNPPMRDLCAAGFALAARVFQAPMPQMHVPASAAAWIERYGATVVDNARRDKSQIFLQLAFVPGWRDRLAVMQRRLAPMKMPRRSDAKRSSSFLMRRAAFHIVALFRFLRTAAEIWF
jgi:hypothetical protein